MRRRDVPCGECPEVSACGEVPILNKIYVLYIFIYIGIAFPSETFTSMWREVTAGLQRRRRKVEKEGEKEGEKGGKERNKR